MSFWYEQWIIFAWRHEYRLERCQLPQTEKSIIINQHLYHITICFLANKNFHSSRWLYFLCCIDHTYTSVPELCSNIVSVPVGRLTFLKQELQLYTDAHKIDLLKIFRDPEASSTTFMNLFMNIVNWHSLLKKFTAEINTAQWINPPPKKSNETKKQSRSIDWKSGLLEDRLTYCKLKNQVTKSNKRKKKE